MESFKHGSCKSVITLSTYAEWFDFGGMKTLVIPGNLENHWYMMSSSNTDTSKWGYGATLNGISMGSRWAVNDLLLYGYMVITPIV